MTQAVLGSAAVIVAALLWSLDGLLRQQLYTLPPSVVVFWEHLIGLIVLLPLVVPRWHEFKRFSPRQWGALAVVALLSGALGTVLYTAALGQVQFIDFSVVVLLQQLQPLFAIGAAGVLLRERLTGRFIGLALVAMGAAYLVSFPDLSIAVATEGTAMAALLALGAAASWGISTALSKYSLRDTSLLHVTATRFAMVPLFALLFVGTLGQTEQLLALSTTQWWYVAAITFSTGGVALLIYYFGLQRIPASRSTLLELTWPLSAVAVGGLFLGDRLTLTQWVGATLLLVSIWLVVRDVERLERQQEQVTISTVS